MSDADKPTTEAKAFKSLIEEKIQGLVDEFAEGKISREQFHILYERYSSRLAIANQALISGNPEAIQIAQSGPPTVLVRDTYQGKAQGMAIYHNKRGNILETLGNFEVPVQRVVAVLKTFSDTMARGDMVERHLEKLDGQKWLLFAPGQYSTVVTLFLNEPAATQIREVERLQHDFEQANYAFLTKDTVDGKQLAYPFVIFVKRWTEKK